MDIIKWLQDTLGTPLANIAGAINPNVVKYSQNALQQSAQGKGPELTTAHALAPLGGPIANLLFGVPNQQAAGNELGADVQGIKSIANGAQGLVTQAQNTTGGLPETPGKAPVVPKVYTSPGGTNYPFKNPGMLGQAKDLLGAIQKIPGVPLVEGAAGALGALKYGVPAAEEAIGGLKAGSDLMTQKAMAGGPSQTPEQQQAQLDADVPNPFTADTVKTTTALTKNMTDLQALQGSQEYAASRQYDPLHVYANKVDAQLANAQTQFNNQSNMQANYTQTATLDQQFNNVINAIGGNTGFAKATDWYKRWEASGDPAFNNFLALLPVLKAQGVDTDKIINGTGDSAKAALDGAKQQMLTEYKSAYKSYGSTPFTPIEAPVPTAQPTPEKTFIPGPLGGGGGLPAKPIKLEPNGMPMKHKIEIPPKYMYR